MLSAERFEDMSQRGRLRVIQQGDGDMIIVVVEDPSSKGCCAGLSASVEFCSSGKSPKTRAALHALMLAMAEENEDSPGNSRRGEIGLGVDEPAPKAAIGSLADGFVYSAADNEKMSNGISLSDDDRLRAELLRWRAELARNCLTCTHKTTANS